MILGLPLPSWLLLFVAVGAGLTVELLFYRARRRDRRAGISPGSGVGGRGDAGAGPDRPEGHP